MIGRYIYGAGRYGRFMLGFCRKHSIDICGFIHSDKNEFIIDELPVISYEKIKHQEEIKEILVAIADEFMCRNLVEKIRVEMPGCKVYNCFSFVFDNIYFSQESYEERGDYLCNVCECRINAFLPGGSKDVFFEKWHIIGGGYRESCLCPKCGATDRDRWLKYVLNHEKILEMPGRLLHFAPEESISQLIKTHIGKIDYYSCDIVPSRAMHCMDITNLLFKDSMFDIVICNHVLEHIQDEKKAIGEIKRVMTDDGLFVFSFPICTDRPSFEDEHIIDPVDRMSFFGQEDHVRLYGIDFKERFEGYGFDVSVLTPHQKLTDDEIRKYGFIEDDIVMIAKKRGR